jgi:predicted Zn-dependent protease
LRVQAAKHDPDDHDKHYLLGKALRKAGRAHEAIEPLRRALRIKPGQLYVELELAVALASCDQHPEASRLLAKVERRLHDWQALKGAGLAARLGDGPRARRLLQHAEVGHAGSGQVRLLSLARQALQRRDRCSRRATAPGAIRSRLAVHARLSAVRTGTVRRSASAVHCRLAGRPKAPAQPLPPRADASTSRGCRQG